uniref:Uncharacterized protein n=1 Tax=Neolamprologus brichardi TaxID=32507 RepID=A0A3Q4MA58_NEOBR
MLRRGSAFAARLARRDRALSLAGLSCRHYSTETAPHIPGMEYQDAICTLNTLQTNASALEQVRRERSNPQLQLNAMRGFLERAGLTVDELNHLNIIHVTGTKGEGHNFIHFLDCFLRPVKFAQSFRCFFCFWYVS